MNLQGILEKATPRPWGKILGPSPGTNEYDDGGDYAIQCEDGIFLEAVRKIGPERREDAEANILLARHAVNNFEPLLKAAQAILPYLPADMLIKNKPEHGVRAVILHNAVKQAEEVIE